MVWWTPIKKTNFGKRRTKKIYRKLKNIDHIKQFYPETIKQYQYYHQNAK